MTKNLQLASIPRHIPMSIYDDVREEIKKRYSNIEGVIAVVESGRVLLPGISDMDFIVIIEPSSAVQAPPMKSYLPDHQYAMSHKHFVISADMFSEVSYIDPWMRGVTPIIGNADAWQLPKHPFNATEFRALSDYFLFVDGIQGYLRDIAYQEAAGEIACHSFLEGIKYIKYFYRELHAAGIVPEEIQDPSIPLYESLREQWFEYSDEQRVKKTNEAFAAMKITTNTITHIFNEHIAPHISYKVLYKTYPAKNIFQKELLRKYPDSVILDTGQEVFVFDPECTQPYAQIQSAKKLPPYVHGSAYTEAVFVLPLALCAFQNNFLESSGPLSSYYESCFITERKEIPMHPSTAITKRADMINKTLIATENVANLKPLFFTYDYEPPNLKTTLRRSLFLWHTKGTKALLHSPLHSLVTAHKSTTTF